MRSPGRSLRIGRGFTLQPAASARLRRAVGRSLFPSSAGHGVESINYCDLFWEFGPVTAWNGASVHPEPDCMAKGRGLSGSSLSMPLNTSNVRKPDPHARLVRIIGSEVRRFAAMRQVDTIGQRGICAAVGAGPAVMENVLATEEYSVPTIMTHSLVGLAAASVVGRRTMPKRFWLFSLILPSLPDLDTAGFVLGLPHSHGITGHRGFSHSLLAAGVIGMGRGVRLLPPRLQALVGLRSVLLRDHRQPRPAGYDYQRRRGRGAVVAIQRETVLRLPAAPGGPRRSESGTS